MDSLDFLLAVVATGVSLFLLTGPAYAWGRRLSARIETRAEAALAELFVADMSARSVVLIATAISAVLAVIGLLATGSVVGGLAGFALGAVLPVVAAYGMIVRRKRALEQQLLDGLITLANGMRAGLNLGQSIGLIEQYGEAPINQEFGLINREVEHGTRIDEALDRAGRRIESHNFRLLFAAMKTTRIRGGNMPETLDRLNESLREIVRLEEKVKAQTAQGRASAIMMGCMPLVVLLIYYFIDPRGVTLMFSDFTGQLTLVIAVVMNVIGFLWLRQVISFEI